MFEGTIWYNLKVITLGLIFNWFICYRVQLDLVLLQRLWYLMANGCNYLSLKYWCILCQTCITYSSICLLKSENEPVILNLRSAPKIMVDNESWEGSPVPRQASRSNSFQLSMTPKSLRASECENLEAVSAASVKSLSMSPTCYHHVKT